MHSEHSRPNQPRALAGSLMREEKQCVQQPRQTIHGNMTSSLRIADLLALVLSMMKPKHFA